MTNRIFAFDIDGVLANTPARFAEIAHAWYGVDFTVRDITSYEMTNLLTDSQVASMLRSPEFYAGITPMIGAAWFTGLLVDSGWRVDLVTARPHEFWATTTGWLARNSIRWTALWHTRDKLAWAKQHQPAYFVEDKLTTVLELAPVVSKVYLIDWYYNRGDLPANVTRVRWGLPQLARLL